MTVGSLYTNPAMRQDSTKRLRNARPHWINGEGSAGSLLARFRFLH